MQPRRFSASAARRVAISAQGLARPRPSTSPTRAHLRTVLRHTGLLQIDTVNVLARAHYLPVFSRLGPYDIGLLDRAGSRTPRMLVEYWAHEASLIPVEDHRLFHWRMQRAEQDAWGSMREAARSPARLGGLVDLVREHGPLTATDLERLHTGGSGAPKGPWWDWSNVKATAEYLFWDGTLTAAGRRGFERIYDLPERVLPDDVRQLPVPDAATAQAELVHKAAVSMGVATAKDLRDYYRLPALEAKEAIAALVDEGRLVPAQVDGWSRPAFTTPGVVVPRGVSARALLAPFDPLVWNRERVERLFGMRYRIEIYVPQERRVHGYYVLPFLLGDALVARVDLKADRHARVLKVQSSWFEDGSHGRARLDVARELALELDQMRQWLALEAIDVVPKGDLAHDLAAVLRSPRVR